MEPAAISELLESMGALAFEAEVGPLVPPVQLEMPDSPEAVDF